MLIILASLCGIVVAALHYRIFFLELPAYGKASFRQIFQVSTEDLPKLKATFNNLAVYNLVVAMNATFGVMLHLFRVDNAYLYGIANGLLFASFATALAAGGFLAYTQPKKRKIAMIQAAPALLGIFFLAIA